MTSAHCLRWIVICAALAAPLTARAQSDSARGKGKQPTTSAATKSTAAAQAKGGAAIPLPNGATARCSDGTWSTAATQQGACSGHGGVAKWFGAAPKGATARCKDGEYWTNASRRGACSGHGGVSSWLSQSPPAAKPKTGK